MRYVIDASVAVRWFLAQFKHRNADRVFELVLNQPGLFAVPELFLNETLAALYRYHPDPQSVFDEDIYPLIRSGVLRYPMTPGVYSRADRFIRMGLTGYDSVYLAVAEEIDGLWLTFDSKAHRQVYAEGRSADLSQEWDADALVC